MKIRTSLVCGTCEKNRAKDPTRYLGPRELPFGSMVVHQIAHLGNWLNINLLGFLLFKVGVLDANEEGAVMFWRWDFWNAKQKAALKRLKREGKA